MKIFYNTTCDMIFYNIFQNSNGIVNLIPTHYIIKLKIIYIQLFLKTIVNVSMA